MSAEMKMDKNTWMGYKERVGRIALFDIFSNIEKKQKKDNAGKTIDYFGLMLLSLLFFFEDMLSRENKAGVRELSLYLKESTQDFYKLEDKDYVEITRGIIEVMRPSAGKRNRRDFMNFETGKMDFVEYSILKVSGWDKEENLQYYALDEHGLELIFATKEYFSEFQISISQLILRKQLEKGEFVDALRQIDEMSINVQSIKDKILLIKHDIQSNIVSDEIYERYKNLVEDINARLNREHIEFEEIALFVRETKNHYEKDMNHQKKDMQVFEKIIKIDNELMKVHNIHSKLLEESIILKTTALEAARESLYYIGMASFNFKQEIVGKVLSEPIPLEEIKLMTKPFLKMSKAKIWTPLSLFAKQRIQKNEVEIKADDFLEIENKKIEADVKIQQKIYAQIFSNILNVIGKRKKIEIKELVKLLDEPWIYVREFYDFFIILHQISPLLVDAVAQKETHIFSSAFKLILETYESVECVECKGEVNVNGKYYIKNMELILKEKVGI